MGERDLLGLAVQAADVHPLARHIGIRCAARQLAHAGCLFKRPVTRFPLQNLVPTRALDLQPLLCLWHGATALAQIIALYGNARLRISARQYGFKTQALFRPSHGLLPTQHIFLAGCGLKMPMCAAQHQGIGAQGDALCGAGCGLGEHALLLGGVAHQQTRAAATGFIQGIGADGDAQGFCRLLGHGGGFALQHPRHVFVHVHARAQTVMLFLPKHADVAHALQRDLAAIFQAHHILAAGQHAAVNRLPIVGSLHTDYRVGHECQIIHLHTSGL